MFILFALYLIGGNTLSDFATRPHIGTIAGMYSSLVVASPTYLWLSDSDPAPPPRTSPQPPKRTGNRAVV